MGQVPLQGEVDTSTYGILQNGTSTVAVLDYVLGAKLPIFRNYELQ